MPIEIRELVIKMTVNKPMSSLGQSATENNGVSLQQLQRIKRDILEECIDKTKELIDKKSNR
jgi:hypothetical protein